MEPDYLSLVIYFQKCNWNRDGEVNIGCPGREGVSTLASVDLLLGSLFTFKALLSHHFDHPPWFTWLFDLLKRSLSLSLSTNGHFQHHVSTNLHLHLLRRDGR